MLDFLKNLSLKKISLNKQVVLIFLLFLIFALLFPAFSVNAQDAKWYDFFNPLNWPRILIGLILQLILLLAQGILAIGIALLGGVISFTLSGAISLTSPARNEIIRIGWTLIRDFVNIGFILGLVYIGLATALRIAGFELKKVFPWFLIMALLINFTPVLCGVVVDAANMVTKFFLGAMASWSLLGEVFSLQMSGLGELFTTTSWVPLAKFVFLTVFGFVAGFILTVFAVLLLLRVVIIPLLVIFSPLAFLAYIFPRTRSYFTQWWNQLLQWSFIGAIGGFFLYLSRLALRQVDDFRFAIPAEEPALGTFMEQIAPYFMAVAFLMVGLFITLKSSAMGANVVTGFAKKQGTKALKWGGKKLGKGAKWTGERATRKGRGKLGAAMEGAKGPIKGAEGEAWWKRGLKIAPRSFSWAMRKTGAARRLTGEAAETYRKDIEEAQKATKGKSLEKQYAMLKSPLPLRRLGALTAIIEDKNLKGIKEMMGPEEEQEKQMKKIMGSAFKLSPEIFKKFAEAEPEIAQKIAGVTGENLKNIGIAKRAGVYMDTDDKEKFGTLAEKIATTIKPSKMEQWTPETMKMALKSQVVHKFWTGAHISEAAKNFGRQFFDVWGVQAAKKKWYDKNNPAMVKYIRSSAGRALGISFGERDIPGETALPGPVEKVERIRRRREGRGRKPPETGAGI